MNPITIDWPLFGLCIVLAGLVIATRVLWSLVKRDEVDHGQ